MQDLVIEWKEDGTHLYEQIYQYIRDEIRRGKLLCQEKLPSTRSLAEYLQVSRSTVELAYDQLVAEGYLEAVPYKGYFVARVEELYQMETAPDAGIMSREQAGGFSCADAGGDCLFLRCRLRIRSYIGRLVCCGARSDRFFSKCDRYA